MKIGSERTRRTPEALFWQHVNVNPTDSGCWLWTGPSTSAYGIFHHREWRTVRAHRQMWILTNGPIPDGLFVCHKCDVTRCVNPGHLFLGTPLDNTRDCISKGRFGVEKRLGENAPNSKLTAEQVLAIRAAEGTQRKIASQFGVTHILVGMIRRRKIWRHI